MEASSCKGMESAYCSGEECFSDCSENGNNVYEEASNDSTTYTVDVAIIGNGPSSIFLSLLLSGHLPYFNGKLKNSSLSRKLNQDQSIIEQDLHYLSEGLEGRSNNPVALLFDALFHPEADVGKEQPSAIKWTLTTNAKKCSHIVIGNEQPGGQWHVMDKSILTLSLSNWLELPVFSFNDWKKEKGPSLIDEKMPDFYPPKGYANLRAMVGDVAEYYTEYVERMDLKDNFKSGLTVEKVEMKRKCPLSTKTSEKEQPAAAMTTTQRCVYKCKNEKPSAEDRGVVCPLVDECHRWIIKSKQSCLTGDQIDSNEVIIQAKSLVLAGGLGVPMKLGVPGEDRDYVITLHEFQRNLHEIKQNGGRVMVIGAGMSGSDLALLCIKEGIPCYHVFKQNPNDSSLMVAGMEPGLYDEYHYLSTLMKGVKTSPLYTPLCQHVVKEFIDDNLCVLTDLKNSDTVTLRISIAVPMIGYGASLNYLPDDVRLHLLSDSTQPVHNKKNPLDVDLYSFRSEVYPNLYALGPLAGDNFVRFVFGSGIGCAQDILYRKCTK